MATKGLLHGVVSRSARSLVLKSLLDRLIARLRALSDPSLLRATLAESDTVLLE